MAELKCLYANADAYIYVTNQFCHGITDHPSTNLLQ